MTWTKRQLVEQAFEEIGYASYIYDLQPEQLQAGLRILDAMMSLWDGIGIRLNYLIPSSQASSNIDDDSGIPDTVIGAVYQNLAVRIAPIVGKVVSPETKANARASYRELLKVPAAPREIQLPITMPLGQGNKPWRQNEQFVREESTNDLLGPNNEANFL